MGGSSVQQPPVPDAGNIIGQDASVNRLDQFTPFGNLTFSGPNNRVANLNFSPEIQGLFNQMMGLQGDALGSAQNLFGGGSFGQGINLDQFSGIQQGFDESGIDFENFDETGLPQIPGDFGEFQSGIEDALFNRGSRLLNPQFDRQEEQLRQTLANQGLFSGDQAAGEQFQIQGENKNRAFADLADQSVLRGGQEASRQLANILGARGQGLQEQGFDNQASGLRAGLAQQQLQNNNAGRQQGLLEQLGIQQGDMAQLAQLMQLGSPNTPGLSDFFGPGQVDVLGAEGLEANVRNQNFQGELQQRSGFLDGLFGLGSAGIGAFGEIKSS